MADFLTIAGAAYVVQTNGASEDAPDYTGSRDRAFDNSLVSTRQNPKRNFTFTIGPISPTQYDALVLATRPDKIVAIAGGFLNGGASFNGVVDIVGEFMTDLLSFVRVVRVTIAES